jgi:putative transcriptional regulator
MLENAGFHDVRPGDLLVSPPQADMGSFSESVILMGVNNEEGTQGWVMNKPTGHRLSEILKDYNIELINDPELYWGGPVGLHTIWMLHSPEWQMNNTRPINEHWSVTSNQAMFHHLSDGDGPRYFKIAMGYSGWGTGQLNDELKGAPPRKHSHSWLILRNPDTGWLDEQNDDELWRDAVARSVQQSVDRVFSL